MDKFLSAKELGLNAAEKQAAVKVLKNLENGTLRHGERGHWDHKVSKMIPAEKGECLFNMAGGDSPHCKTPSCIGGWMSYYLGNKTNGIGGLRKQVDMAFTDVFYPYGEPENWSKFTTEQSAKALRAKLETGKAEWPQ